MKRELDIGDDPLSLTYPSYPTSRGESTSEHGTAEYREGYGFDIDFFAFRRGRYPIEVLFRASDVEEFVCAYTDADLESAATLGLWRKLFASQVP